MVITPFMITPQEVTTPHLVMMLYIRTLKEVTTPHMGSNLYFTTPRARQSIGIGADSDELRYDDTTGLLTYHGSAVILSDNAPTSNLRDGFIWYDTLTTGRSYVYSETIGSWIDLTIIHSSTYTGWADVVSNADDLNVFYKKTISFSNFTNFINYWKLFACHMGYFR